jgi:hypothetical protein
VVRVIAGGVGASRPPDPPSIVAFENTGLTDLNRLRSFCHL